MTNKKTITICGSMTFFEQMKALQTRLEGDGYQVWIPTAEEVSFEDLSAQEKIRAKKQYIQEHLDRIRSSDQVIVANYTKNGIKGYVGANTLIEIAFARAFEKPIFLLEVPGEQSCIDELHGFEFEILSEIDELKRKR